MTTQTNWLRGFSNLYGAFPVKWLFCFLPVLCSEQEGRSSFFNRAAGGKRVLSASGLRILVSTLVGCHWLAIGAQKEPRIGMQRGPLYGVGSGLSR
jgi:hypothetical protein